MTTSLERPTVDAQWLAVADAIASRGTCSRARVGAVLVLDEGRHLFTGRNGAPPGVPHCEHPDDRPCVVSTHAEANLARAVPALIRTGRDIEGSTVYCTHAPCLACAWELRTLRIGRLVYRHPYRHTRGLDALASFGIRTEQHA